MPPRRAAPGHPRSAWDRGRADRLGGRPRDLRARWARYVGGAAHRPAACEPGPIYRRCRAFALERNQLRGLRLAAARRRTRVRPGANSVHPGGEALGYVHPGANDQPRTSPVHATRKRSAFCGSAAPRRVAWLPASRARQRTWPRTTR